MRGDSPDEPIVPMPGVKSPEGTKRFERWLLNLAATRSFSMRFGLWCEAFETLSDEETARLLDYVMHVARRTPEGLLAYLVLLDFPSLLERVGAGRMAGVLEAARRLDFRAGQLFLEHPGERAVPEDLGPPPDPVLEKITLGQRRTAARGLRSHLLERILKDPDPRVVRETLRNPRLREAEVVAIASRRPCPESVFWDIARADRWISRQSVRRAVALNPYAPPRLAVALLVTFPEQELREIADVKRLHPSVTDGAREILTWRLT
jgi:hypothetical protein